MAELWTPEQTKQLADFFGPMVAAAMDEKIKAYGLDKVDVKHGMFPGINTDPNVERKAREKMFLEAVLFGKHQNDPFIIKALSEGSTTAGGYLVPDEVRAELIMWAMHEAQLFPYVRKVPISTDAGNMPKASTGVTFTWLGATENTDFTDTDPVFGQITWNAYLANGVTYMSRQLVNDSNPNIVDVVKRLFADAYAEELDKVIAIGSGSSKPKGIYSETGLDSEAFAGAVTYTHLVNLKYKLKQRYQRGAVWVMNSTILGDCVGLQDSQNMPIFQQAALEGVPDKLLGKAVRVNDDFPDHTIFYGDLSYYIFFDREQMGFEATTEGGDTFKKHELGLKCWFRCDGKLALNGSGKLGAGVRGTGITT